MICQKSQSSFSKIGRRIRNRGRYFSKTCYFCLGNYILCSIVILIEGDGKPDTEINKDIAINWEEVRSDLEEQYLEPYGPFADYVMDLNVVYDDASGMLTVLLPVTKKTTSDVAVVYAQDVLGTIGEAVSTQNFYFTAPEENEDGYTTDYGSFFDEHDVKVQVFPYDKEGDESAYLVNDTIKAGDVRAVEPLQ